jgi:hypothetical protein
VKRILVTVRPLTFSRRSSGKIISNRPAPPEYVVTGASTNDTLPEEAFVSISTGKKICVYPTT